MVYFTCWNLSQFPGLPLHDQDGANVAHRCQGPWFSQRVDLRPVEQRRVVIKAFMSSDSSWYTFDHNFSIITADLQSTYIYNQKWTTVTSTSRNVKQYIVINCILDLIGVCDNKRALVREVVIDVWDDLYGHVRFTRSRGSNYHSQTWLHAWPYGLNLGGGERNLISERKFHKP